MRVKSLKIRNFRGIESMDLDFGDSNIAVLVGVNGSGKSSVLDCVKFGLAAGLADLVPGIQARDFFKKTDVRNGFERSQNELKLFVGAKEVEVGLFLGSEGIFPDFEYVVNPDGDLDEIYFENANSKPSLPIIVAYPTNRSIFNIDVEPSYDGAFLDRLAFLKGALGGASLDFNSFFKWFREREDLENEKRIENSDYRDPQMQALRKAILQFLDTTTGASYFSELKIVRGKPSKMVVLKQGIKLYVDQLSDGEKCALMMAADIARRLAMANPGLEDPLQGEGVVLIDEIDLHLHPAWQRKIVKRLTKTFPNCQFIVTTHSPQVIGEVKPENIFLLKADKSGKITAERPPRSYGRDSNQILDTVMGATSRSEETEKKLDEYFQLIDDGKIDEAQKLRAELEKEIGSDEPEFDRADELIHLRKILRD